MVKKINAIQTNDTINLINKTDYDAKVVAIEKKIPDHDKYITTTEFNKLTTEIFAERLKQASLASKNHSAGFVKKTYFD